MKISQWTILKNKIDNIKFSTPNKISNELVFCLILFQMCSRENEEEEISKIGDLTRKVTKLEESLKETNRKLDILLAGLTNQEQSGWHADLIKRNWICCEANPS